MFRPPAGFDFHMISGAGGPGFVDFFESLGRTIPFHPEMARMLGSKNAALFLQQLMWWTPKSKNPDGWVYKSAEEWEEETSLTYEEQLYVRKLLRSKKILEERHARLEHRVYFRVNREVLNDLWDGRAVGQNPIGQLGRTQLASKGKPNPVVPVDDSQEKTSETTTTSTRAAKKPQPEPTVVSKQASPVSKKHSAAKEKKLKTQAAPRGRTGEAPRVPPPPAAAQTDPFLARGFDLLWAVIPKRISKGTAKVEAWEVWKRLTPSPPTRRHVAEMVRLLKDFLEEESGTGDHALYDIDGSVQVTPARLIGLLCAAMKEGTSLGDVLERDSFESLATAGGDA